MKANNMLAGLDLIRRRNQGDDSPAHGSGFVLDRPLPKGIPGAAPACFSGVIRGGRSSKVWRIRLALCCSLFALGAAAQYSLDWHTIDGGGGTSTGGVYAVSGTIGQADAGGPMTNGPYSVTGGFWALPVAVPVPGAPTLAIVAATPGHARISWSPNRPGFVLQETLSLSPTNWVNSGSGATNPVVVPATQPTKFYRLFKSTNPGP